VNAEKAFLACLLRAPDAIADVEDWFVPSMFYLLKHQWIYEAILACARCTPPLVPDVSTVSSILRQTMEGEDTRLVAVGGRTYLTELATEFPVFGGLEQYLRFVLHTWYRRRLIEVSGHIAAIAYDEESTLEQSLQLAEEALLHVTQDHNLLQGARLIKEGVNAFWEKHQQYLDGTLRRENQFLPTPFCDLNRFLGGGLRRGNLYIVAARPGVGKTAFAQTIAMAHGVKGLPAVFFSLEMSEEQIILRFLSMLTGFSSQFLQSDAWHRMDDVLDQVINGLSIIYDWPLYVDERMSQVVSTVQAEVRKSRDQSGRAGVVLVDYLQLLQSTDPKTGKRSDFRPNEVASVAYALKELARSNDVPVLALAQLNRAVEGRSKSVPVLSDLRESGGIEQAADAVLLMHRREGEEGIIDVQVAKNRDGEMGTVPLFFDAKTTTFRSLARGDGDIEL
jgi:replicative DNA helicase